jgi:hypothetical protein
VAIQNLRSKMQRALCSASTVVLFAHSGKNYQDPFCARERELQSGFGQDSTTTLPATTSTLLL